MGKQWFSKAMACVLAIVLIGLGAGAFVLPLSYALRDAFVTFLAENKLLLVSTGTFCIACGSGLLAWLILSFNTHSYVIQGGSRSIRVDSSVVNSSVQTYLQGQFPDQVVQSTVKASRRGVRIAVQLPVAHEECLASLTERVEKDLKNLVARVLGEQSAMRLDIHFKSQTPYAQSP